MSRCKEGGVNHSVASELAPSLSAKVLLREFAKSVAGLCVRLKLRGPGENKD